MMIGISIPVGFHTLVFQFKQKISDTERRRLCFICFEKGNTKYIYIIFSESVRKGCKKKDIDNVEEAIKSSYLEFHTTLVKTKLVKVKQILLCELTSKLLSSCFLLFVLFANYSSKIIIKNDGKYKPYDMDDFLRLYFYKYFLFILGITTWFICLMLSVF